MEFDSKVLALIGAAGGWIVSLVLAVTAYMERRAQRHQERLVQALSKLAGSTAERNIGLALIEGWWVNTKKHDVVLIPALASVAVSLLLDDSVQRSRQEFHNWLRIMKLLLQRPYDKQFGSFYDEIHHALYCCSEEPEPNGTGIGMTPETAKLWLAKFEGKWEIGHLE